MNTIHKRISKMMSYALRHNPSSLHLHLDDKGWCSTEELIKNMQKKGIDVDFKRLEEVVSTNDKQRFSFDTTKQKIRANQGHSIQVNVELKTETPPHTLYHGTVSKFMDSIRKEGLLKMSRQHVHLSQTKDTAIQVGSRRGKPIILKINAYQMHQDGYIFYLSENNVWLTDQVPPHYIN